MSPYPTVPTVTTAHHSARPIDVKVFGSTMRTRKARGEHEQAVDDQYQPERAPEVDPVDGLQDPVAEAHGPSPMSRTGCVGASFAEAGGGAQRSAPTAPMAAATSRASPTAINHDTSENATPTSP